MAQENKGEGGLLLRPPLRVLGEGGGLGGVMACLVRDRGGGGGGRRLGVRMLWMQWCRRAVKTIAPLSWRPSDAACHCVAVVGALW